MMEINWTDRVRNEEVLHMVKEDRIILQTIKRRRLTGFVTILRFVIPVVCRINQPVRCMHISSDITMY